MQFEKWAYELMRMHSTINLKLLKKMFCSSFKITFMFLIILSHHLRNSGKKHIKEKHWSPKPRKRARVVSKIIFSLYGKRHFSSNYKIVVRFIIVVSAHCFKYLDL